MNFFFLEPEVAGGWGEKTVADTSVHPPVVHELHYEFDGWSGGCIVESFPCFAVTEEAKHQIEIAGLTGGEFAYLTMSTSEQFDEVHPGLTLPRFFWLKVVGVAGRDDFGIAVDHRLVVSDIAFGLLEKLGLSDAISAPF